MGWEGCHCGGWGRDGVGGMSGGVSLGGFFFYEKTGKPYL